MFNNYSVFFRKKQRGRDSNPRYACGVYTLSRRTPSTTRTPLSMLFLNAKVTNYFSIPQVFS